MNFCGTCGTAIRAQANYCGQCGTPLSASLPAGSSVTAVASGGGGEAYSAGRDIHIGAGSWDNRPEVDTSSGSKSHIAELPAWGSFILAGAGLLGGVVGWVNDWFGVIVLGLLVVGVAGVALVALRGVDHLPLRIGGHFLGFLHRSPSTRKLYLRFPTADCIFCPEGSKGLMRLRVSGDNFAYLCSRNRSQHIMGFDWTQLPDPAQHR